jgi:two-component system LytT family response regulator
MSAINQVYQTESGHLVDPPLNTGIRCIIADNVPSDRERLQSLLQQQPDLQVVGECGDGEQVISAVQATTPDVLFLDVQLPKLSGFDVLSRLRFLHLPIVIFITASGEHAVEAFNQDAVDYILKPLEIDRLTRSIKRARQQMLLSRFRESLKGVGDLGHLQQVLGSAPANPGSGFPEHFAVKVHGRIFFVSAAEIDYVQAAGNYVEIHAGKKVYVTRTRINSMETRLNPSKFMRIHRSTIVSFSSIAEIERLETGDYSVQLKSGQILSLSRNYRAQLNRLF